MKPSTSKGRTALRWSLLVLVLFAALAATLFFRLGPELRRPPKISPAFQIASPMLLARLPTAARFDFPIGNENGGLGYNAPPLTQKPHLCEEPNKSGGANRDHRHPPLSAGGGRSLVHG